MDTNAIEARHVAATDSAGGDAIGGPLLAAMNRLAPEYRVVLMLWAVDELSYAEIAEALGIPEGTVMSRLHRARKKLAEDLKKQEE